MECRKDAFSKNSSMFESGVAVIGSTTIDENIAPAGRWHKIGGVATYSGITYRRHGIATIIVSNIAPGDRQVRTVLEKEKIVETMNFSTTVSARRL